MKSTLKDLKERRSIRSYKPEQIPEDVLDAILEAGTYAPSGFGKQSARMIVVQKEEDIKRMAEMNAAVRGIEGDPFYGAPTVVVVLADKSSSNYKADGDLVMGNLMNAAHAMGIGSCWINRAKEVFDTKEGKALLQEWGIEGDYEGIGNCILGYAEGDMPVAKPRKENYIIKIK